MKNIEYKEYLDWCEKHNLDPMEVNNLKEFHIRKRIQLDDDKITIKEVLNEFLDLKILKSLKDVFKHEVKLLYTIALATEESLQVQDDDNN